MEDCAEPFHQDARPQISLISIFKTRPWRGGSKEMILCLPCIVPGHLQFELVGRRLFHTEPVVLQSLPFVTDKWKPEMLLATRYTVRLGQNT
jgi:hypothetical protein